MYITGTQYDFASRLHQLALMSLPYSSTGLTSGRADIATFITEGRSYLAGGTVTDQESGKWEIEARRLLYQLSGDGNVLLSQMF